MAKSMSVHPDPEAKSTKSTKAPVPFFRGTGNRWLQGRWIMPRNRHLPVQQVAAHLVLYLKHAVFSIVSGVLGNFPLKKVPFSKNETKAWLVRQRVSYESHIGSSFYLPRQVPPSTAALPDFPGVSQN